MWNNLQVAPVPHMEAPTAEPRCRPFDFLLQPIKPLRQFTPVFVETNRDIHLFRKKPNINRRVFFAHESEMGNGTRAA